MALTITLSNTSGASYVFSKILQFQLKKRGLHPLYDLFRTISDRWLEKVRDDLQSHRTEWQSSCSRRNG